MIQQATFAGGCFWCTEAVFQRVRGVVSVTPGYTGGVIDKPSYEQVANGATGHAEAIQMQFDPSIVSYETLVKIFFGTHNPTTENRQGNDIGTQYRSAIFFHNQEQRMIAEKVLTGLEQTHVFKKQIITEILPASDFFEAEKYHRDYYQKNPDNPYCQAIINPKLVKLRKSYSKYLRD
jgi:peptide-methionine (S)-S-oxide reductase